MPNGAAFTNTTSHLAIYKDGHIVYHTRGNMTDRSFSVTIEPKQWDGLDPIQFQSEISQFLLLAFSLVAVLRQKLKLRKLLKANTMSARLAS